MKRFFTIIPLQVRGNLKTYLYEAVGNQKLQMQTKTAFPIIAAMEGYLEAGESFDVVTVVSDSQTCRDNLQKFQEELAAVCERTGAVCREMQQVWLDDDERVAAQISTFQKLIDFVQDEDDLYCCMTYGTKPQSTAMMMAVQYAYRVMKNASIECVVYGQVRRDGTDQEAWNAKIYDMTALVQMDEIVRVLADRGVKNPKELIDKIISL